MKIPIPRSYDRAMDWLAIHLIPPDKPIGLKLFGHAVTWADLATFAGYPSVMAIALTAWTGNWLWIPATALCMALAWFWLEMLGTKK